MKKVNNLKADFSKFLESEYHMTQEGINGYWKREEKRKRANTSFSLGIGGAIGWRILGLPIAIFNMNELKIPLLVLAGLSGSLLAEGIIGKVMIPKGYDELDKEYKEFRLQYKRTRK